MGLAPECRSRAGCRQASRLDGRPPVLPGRSRQSDDAEHMTARTMARRQFAGATKAGLTVADGVGLLRDVSSRDGAFRRVWSRT